MSDKVILCLILLAEFACVSALCEIVTRWLEELVHRGIEKRRKEV